MTSTALEPPASPVVLGLPVYNGARYVAEAISSLCAQTYQDFVLVVSDNASTDGTEEICRDLAAHDSRIHYVRQHSNIGAIANFNGTFDLARRYRPTFFRWCAHDDVCAPRLLERCLTALDADPDAVLAYPATTLIDEDGNELVGLADETARASSADPAERFRDVLLNEVWCFPIFGVMRAALLDRAGLLLPFASADKVLLAKLALMAPFAHVPEVLFLRRAHDEQLTVMAPAAKAAWAGRRARVPEPLLSCDGYVRAIGEVPLTSRQRHRARLALAHLTMRQDTLRKVFLPGPYNYLGWRGRRPRSGYAHLGLRRGARIAGAGPVVPPGDLGALAEERSA